MTIITLDRAFIPQGVDSDRIYLVNEAVMTKLTGVLSPEGILAEVPLPNWDTLKNKKWIVALDGVSDPGNLGTILRTALAFGWDGVYLLENTCDPFNDKALRAAKGATFKIPLASGSWEQLAKIAQENQLEIIAADMNGTEIETLDKKKGKLLVLGNEGQGLSKHVKDHAKKVSIPMSGEMESLNVAVAGGILMYALKGGSHV
jgi:TrmH family RNA methyltransferase